MVDAGTETRARARGWAGIRTRARARIRVGTKCRPCKMSQLEGR